MYFLFGYPIRIKLFRLIWKDFLLLHHSVAQISPNLTWYSAIVHKFTRIYPVYSNYELEKTIHENLCKQLRNGSHKRITCTEQAVGGFFRPWFFLAKFEKSNLLRILLENSIECVHAYSAPNRSLSGFKIYAVTFILICISHNILLGLLIHG